MPETFEFPIDFSEIKLHVGQNNFDNKIHFLLYFTFEGNSFPSPFQSQGEYSTLNLNEGGTKVTQENVIDHKNNIMINTVPSHNGRAAAKFVFDGDSVSTNV